jgi:tellurite resistance protein TerC
MVLDALCAAHHPWYMWAGFVALVLAFLAIDLGIFHRKTHAVSIKEAVIWAVVWFGAAMIFNALVLWQCGAQKGLEFFTGYIIEKSLSVDNLFVILLVFTAFSIPAKLQHRVLFWGIVGALVMRGALIGIGAALITRFDWIFYLFGAFLLYTGFKMFFEKEEKFDPKKSWIVRWIERIVPVQKLDSDHFFTRHKGKFAVTILFVALIVVEFTDLVFAFDSIPAIFAITTDPFIVFTSNVFAILGLRSLYFVIAKAHDMFSHLKTGLAVILVFIGLKLLAKDIYHMNIFVSLGVVLGILAISIIASIFHIPRMPWESKDDHNRKHHPERLAKKAGSGRAKKKKKI